MFFIVDFFFRLIYTFFISFLFLCYFESKYKLCGKVGELLLKEKENKK